MPSPDLESLDYAEGISKANDVVGKYCQMKIENKETFEKVRQKVGQNKLPSQTIEITDTDRAEYPWLDGVLNHWVAKKCPVWEEFAEDLFRSETYRTWLRISVWPKVKYEFKQWNRKKTGLEIGLVDNDELVVLSAYFMSDLHATLVGRVKAYMEMYLFKRNNEKSWLEHGLHECNKIATRELNRINDQPLDRPTKKQQMESERQEREAEEQKHKRTSEIDFEAKSKKPRRKKAKPVSFSELQSSDESSPQFQDPSALDPGFIAEVRDSAHGRSKK